jgi:hypothetical protein
MGAIFRVGEQKVRPGSFIRYENAGSAQSAGATAGVAAAVFKADWGPLGKVVDIESQGQKDKLYGTANGTTNTSDVIDELLKGVARIKAVRLGAGGTKATLALKDTAATPATVVNATAKYPGTKALSVTIKDSIIEATKREFIVYSGTTELQKIVFDKDSGDVDTLINAWKAAGSDWVDLTKGATGTGILATISGQSLSGGANPTITNADYTDAFSVLEPIE